MPLSVDIPAVPGRSVCAIRPAPSIEGDFGVLCGSVPGAAPVAARIGAHAERNGRNCDTATAVKTSPVMLMSPIIADGFQRRCATKRHVAAARPASSQINRRRWNISGSFHRSSNVGIASARRSPAPKDPTAMITSVIVSRWLGGQSPLKAIMQAKAPTNQAIPPPSAPTTAGAILELVPGWMTPVSSSIPPATPPMNTPPTAQMDPITRTAKDRDDAPIPCQTTSSGGLTGPAEGLISLPDVPCLEARADGFRS